MGSVLPLSSIIPHGIKAGVPGTFLRIALMIEGR
jgi:hypothetical protein